MIECARCGYRNDAAAKFCAACGAPMMVAQAGPAAAPPAWGQNPGPPAAVAQGWGASMQQAAPQQFGPPPQPVQAAPWAAPQAQAAAPPGYAPFPMAPPGYGAPQGAPQGVPPGAYPMHAQGAASPAQPHAAGPAPQGYASPYGAAPWAAPAPQPQPPAWGAAPAAAYATPPDVPLAPTVPEPAAAPVVPTTASAVMEPPEPDQLPNNAPRTLTAFFVTFDQNPLGDFWPIHQGTTLIGRKDSGGDAKLELDHPTTSSRHANVYAAARPGRLKVEDLGSTNGTYVNERRLESGERRSLAHGDTLRFGGFSVTVHLV